MGRTLEEWRALKTVPGFFTAATHASTAEFNVTAIRNGQSVTLSILYIPAIPVELARQAKCTVEEYSLGRLMASEGYSGADYTLAMMLIGTVVMNTARKRAPKAVFPISTLLTYSIYPQARGKYGEQAGRYASTSKDPTFWHLLLAKAIIAGEVPDMTRGATKFVDPWPPGATQRGKPLPPFDRKMTAWSKEVAWVGTIPGIEDDKLALFRPEKDPAIRRVQLDKLLTIWRLTKGRESESEGHTQSSPANPKAPLS